MIIVSTEEIAGRRTVETKGEVLRPRGEELGAGENIAAGLRSLTGKEIRETRGAEGHPPTGS